jgi:ABC-type phosphate transport system permease subunit
MLTTIVTALLADIASLATEVGLVIVAALGIAVAVYGAKYAWALFTQFVRARQSR